ncbi:MAG TPA: FecR domain-containing protein, partial [Opitutaceae bacterium]|nr:FecR domain-containing protein [Opitutaceae bacterium]
MNNKIKHKTEEEETIDEIAATWLVQLDEGLSDHQAQELARWRQSDPRHEAAYNRLYQMWKSMQELRHLRPASEISLETTTQLKGVPLRSLRFFYRGIGLAAAAAVIFFVTALWLEPARDFSHTYSASVYGPQPVTLPDHSVIALSSDTEVQVRYSKNERKVRLIRGEARFTVAKNPDRPFIVGAGRVSVRAVGTAFNVRIAKDRINVLVTEGRVQVDRSSVDGSLSNSQIDDSSVQLLAAG